MFPIVSDDAVDAVPPFAVLQQFSPPQVRLSGRWSTARTTRRPAGGIPLVTPGRPAPIRHMAQVSLIKSRRSRARRSRRLVLALVGTGGVVVALLSAPVWRQTPKGVNPAIHARGLDLYLAWSFARSARKAAAEGRTGDALFAWRSAIASRHGDPRLLREAVDFVAELPNPDTGALAFGITCSQWLLRSSGESPADVGRVLRLLETHRYDEEAVAFGTPHEPRLGAGDARHLLFAHLHLLHLDEFSRLWARFADTYARDELMQLYHDAAQAMTGPPEVKRTARTRIESATDSGPLANHALRLSLVIAFHHSDIDAYDHALDRLRQEHRESLQDQIRQWTLLYLSGRHQQAHDAVDRFNAALKSPTEILRLAEALVGIGLRDSALRLLREHAPSFTGHVALWTLYSGLLIETDDTEGANVAFTTIRAHQELAGPLRPHGLLLEIVARNRSGHPDALREVANELADFDGMPPAFARFAATNLRLRGWNREAGRLLARFANTFALDPLYWLERIEVAHDDRDPDALLEAARAAHRALPNNEIFIHNLATALLFDRTHPHEAVALTFDLLNRNPDFPNARINHVSALFQLGRTSEASDQLRQITTPRKDLSEEAAYQLAWMEEHIARQAPSAIRETAARIPVTELFPAQKDRVTEALCLAEELLHRAGSPSAH